MKLYWIKRKEMTDPLTEGYIGVTERDIEKRFAEHKKNPYNSHLKNAINKYDDVEVVVIHEGESDEILKMESVFRASANIGWNIAPGGGMPPSSENWWTEEHSVKTSARMTGNTFKKGKTESLTTRENKSKTYAENYEHRSHAQKNKSSEWKMKASLNRKGKGMGKANAMTSVEAREKVSASKRGRKRVYRPDGTFYMSKVG